MWEYRIIKCDLWWNIYKKKEGDGYISLRFLGSQGKWVLNKDWAKIYYNREDAASDLVLVRHKDGKDAD